MIFQTSLQILCSPTCERCLQGKQISEQSWGNFISNAEGWGESWHHQETGMALERIFSFLSLAFSLSNPFILKTSGMLQIKFFIHFSFRYSLAKCTRNLCPMQWSTRLDPSHALSSVLKFHPANNISHVELLTKSRRELCWLVKSTWVIYCL